MANKMEMNSLEVQAKATPPLHLHYIELNDAEKAYWKERYFAIASTRLEGESLDEVRWRASEQTASHFSRLVYKRESRWD